MPTPEPKTRTLRRAETEAARVLIARNSERFKTKDFAEHVGVDPVSVSRWNSDGWPQSRIDQLIEYLDLTISDFARELR